MDTAQYQCSALSIHFELRSTIPEDGDGYSASIAPIHRFSMLTFEAHIPGVNEGQRITLNRVEGPIPRYLSTLGPAFTRDTARDPPCSDPDLEFSIGLGFRNESLPSDPSPSNRRGSGSEAEIGTHNFKILHLNAYILAAVFFAFVLCGTFDPSRQLYIAGTGVFPLYIAGDRGATLLARAPRRLSHLETGRDQYSITRARPFLPLFLILWVKTSIGEAFRSFTLLLCIALNPRRAWCPVKTNFFLIWLNIFNVSITNEGVVALRTRLTNVDVA
ncbi:hypothetical protein DFH09DRAFT_1105332 [Mycena vulgaris]|nr:hypothetical protein DFH09DRAFT_1105332 [Mycena vulgaris]